MTTYYKNVFLLSYQRCRTEWYQTHPQFCFQAHILQNQAQPTTERRKKISPQWTHVSNTNDIPAVIFSLLEFLNNWTLIPTFILCDLAPLWLVQLHDLVTLLFHIYCFTPLMMASFLYLTLDPRLTSTQAYSIRGSVFSEVLYSCTKPP